MAKKKYYSHGQGQDPSHDYDKYREDYIVRNLEPGREKPYSIRDVATAFGVSFHTLKGVATEQKWRDQLRERAKERSDLAIEKAKLSAAETEAEVRVRHATICKSLIEKANKKFENIDSPESQLTIDNMLKFFQMAMEGEREALGLPKIVQHQHMELDAGDEHWVSPEVRIKRMKHQGALRDELLGLLADADEG